MATPRILADGGSAGAWTLDPRLVLLSAGLLSAGLAVLLQDTPVMPLFLGVLAGVCILLIANITSEGWSRLRSRRLPRHVEAALRDAGPMACVTDRSLQVLAANDQKNAFGFQSANGTLQQQLVQLSLSPGETIECVLNRLDAGEGADARLGLSPGSQRLWAQRLGRSHILWQVMDSHDAQGFAVLTVVGQSIKLNDQAAALFDGNTDALARELSRTRIRNGELRSLPSVDGPLAVRLFLLRGWEGRHEYAVIPEPHAQPDAPVDHPAVSKADDLLRLLPVPMVKIKADGTLLEANPEARGILSLGEDAWPAIFELVEGMGRPIAEWIADAVAGRGLLRPEIVRAVIPGQELYLQITLGRMLEAGEVVLVGILNDATQLKTLEAQFVQSQKMQAIGQLAGGVAHDFNNLLTAISGHCDLLLLRHDAHDPEYADLIQISQNANRAASLVGQLLAFSRKQNLKPQSLDLRDTMVDLAHLLNRLIGERIRLEVTHAPGPQMIRADRRQLEQVIVNLVVNARDAMPDGGKITVQTRTELLSDEMTRDRARLVPGEYVVIEVADTGTGIPEEVRSKIFEPFFTTKKTGEGTGLGLSTAYGIVKQTGGYIFVESEMGEGTTFSLYFPAASPEQAEPVEEKSAPVTGAPRRLDASILLVEDEAPVRAFAVRALRLRGYNVIEAAHAEEALEILSDKQLTIDLFVTDVIMPGMDGPTWVRKALRDRPDTGVVFMSGYAEEGRAEKQARIPNSDFLPKPFSLQQLTNLVHEKLQ